MTPQSELQMRSITKGCEDMTRKSLTGVIAGAIACCAAAGVAAESVTSVKTAAAPTLDGVAEAAWDAAEAVSLSLNQLPYKSNVYPGATETSVRIKAMHDDATLYMLIEWTDPTESLERQPWRKQSDGSWKQLKAPDDTKHENTYYEDKFALLWDINARGFDKKGCASACHMAENGMIDGIEAKSPGRKFTAAGQTIDMWHWKSVRTGPVGQIDDQYIDENTDAAKNGGWGRKNDAKTAGGYADNVSEDKTLPAFMPSDGATGAFWLDKADAVPFVDSFAAGDILPAMIVERIEGSRGDVSAVAKWSDGKWTMELSRALATTGEKDAVQDVQFADLSKEYSFGVAVFDNTAINHMFHEGALKLRFAN